MPKKCAYVKFSQSGERQVVAVLKHSNVAKPDFVDGGTVTIGGQTFPIVRKGSRLTTIDLTNEPGEFILIAQLLYSDVPVASEEPSAETEAETEAEKTTAPPRVRVTITNQPPGGGGGGGGLAPVALETLLINQMEAAEPV